MQKIAIAIAIGILNLTSVSEVYSSQATSSDHYLKIRETFEPVQEVTWPVDDDNPWAHETISAPDDEMVKVVRDSLQQAYCGDPSISKDLEKLEGMSSRRFRFFLNLLPKKIDKPRYLEVGLWKGSTFCSAIWNNASLTAAGVDNWSLFGGPKEACLENVKKFSEGNPKISVIDSDFKKVTYTKLQGSPFNIYFYDGGHSYEEQRDCLKIVDAALDNKFLFIVDDYNWKEVREGTKDALKGYNVLYQFEVRTTMDDSHSSQSNTYSNHHNGLFVAVLQKRL